MPRPIRFNVFSARGFFLSKIDGVPIDQSIISLAVLHGSYAVLSTPPSDATNFVAAIQETWNYIFNEWFHKSGYEYAPGCNDFELYDGRCMLDEGKICDIYIPVVKTQ